MLSPTTISSVSSNCGFMLTNQSDGCFNERVALISVTARQNGKSSRVMCYQMVTINTLDWDPTITNHHLISWEIKEVRDAREFYLCIT